MATLGCIEVFERHTAPQIKNLILQVLNQFDLNLDNIIANTSDNAANCLLATHLMDDEQIKKEFQYMFNLAQVEASLQGDEDDHVMNLPLPSEGDDFFEQLMEKINEAFGITGIKKMIYQFQFNLKKIKFFKNMSFLFKLLDVVHTPSSWAYWTCYHSKKKKMQVKKKKGVKKKRKKMTKTKTMKNYQHLLLKIICLW